MKYTLGFIGCGNMGGALIKAASPVLRKGTLAVCDHNEEKTAYFIENCGAVNATAEEIAQEAKFILLGVKPQVMERAIEPIAELLKQRKDAVVVTMAAGLSVSAIRSFIGADLPVIRIMPNMPVAVNEGMLLYSVADVSEEDHHLFLECFKNAGAFDLISENEIDAGSALAGCGPAFVYAFAEALIDGAVECGVPQEKAVFYTAQTLVGAGKMLSKFGNPSKLKKDVCSPNGTTLAGIYALEEADFHKIAKSAVTNAYRRTLELKK